MCGIIGFYSKDKKTKEIKILKKLMVESSIRGIHSFGIAYIVQNKIIIKKAFRLRPNWLLSDFMKNGGNRLIFHCRYSTSGDFKDMNNNQPILNNNIAVVVNGIISMEEKHLFEKKFSVKCETNNDAEIILSQNKSYIEFLKSNPQISFAGIFLKKNKIISLRNNKRPLYFFRVGNASFFISTVDIAYRSGISKSKIKIVPEMQEIKI